MTREQYTDLMDSLDALARHLDDLTAVEAAVNFCRDHGRPETSVGEVLHELDDPSSGKPWRRQARYKHQDLAALIARVRTLCGDTAGFNSGPQSRDNELLTPNCAA